MNRIKIIVSSEVQHWSSQELHKPQKQRNPSHPQRAP